MSSIRESIAHELRPKRPSAKPGSGEHPAVKEFRSKLMSIAGHADKEFEELEDEIAQCDSEAPPAHTS